MEQYEQKMPRRSGTSLLNMDGQGYDAKDHAISGTNVLVNDTKGIQNLQKQGNLSLMDSMTYVRRDHRRRAFDGRIGQTGRRQASRGCYSQRSG